MNEQVVDYKEKYQQLQGKYLQLEHELAQLKRLVFGSRHERFIPSLPPEQLIIGLQEETSQPQPSLPKLQTIEYTRRKKDKEQTAGAGRQPLPASLPRIEEVIEPDEDVKGCKKIGQEITEVLEYTPGKLYVRQYVRPKYARVNGEGITIGRLPSRMIEKSIAAPSLMAQLVVNKYVYHLPVYRQSQQLENESGYKIPDSTLYDIIAYGSQALEPLMEKQKQLILSSGYIQADETPIRVLDKDKKGTTHKGFYWVYHDPVYKMTLFDYRTGRGREGPKEFLNGFKGYLQSDGYEVYCDFEKKEHIHLLNCWAHARRKFDQALDNDKLSAEQALTWIQKLYKIEADIRQEGLSERETVQRRQQQAVPVLEELRTWLIQNYSVVLPKSLIGKAISYTLERWEKLSVYTTNGHLRIDNNLVENSIRPVALGRKNYLFAGSHQAAQRAAMVYSLMATCKYHHINPCLWLTDVYTRIADHSIKDIDLLLPHNWVKNQPGQN